MLLAWDEEEMEAYLVRGGCCVAASTRKEKEECGNFPN
jgi:hypothetical protein